MQLSIPFEKIICKETKLQTIQNDELLRRKDIHLQNTIKGTSIKDLLC